MTRRILQADMHSVVSTALTAPSCKLSFFGSPRRRDRRTASKSRSGFSLIELLVVMGILAILMIALLPKITSVGSNQSITQAFGAIPDLLRQARAYAMANNTYVYVGIEQGGKNNDQVFLGIVASKNGTSGISGSTFQKPEDNLLPLQRIQTFDGVKMEGTSLTGMDGSGVPLADSSASFAGSLISGSSTVTFKKIIQFSPDGTAHGGDLGGTAALQPYIQAVFEPARGNSKNRFGVQVDGVSGQVRAFRPEVGA